MKSLLVLYKELAGYMVNCLNVLAEEHDVRIHVVAYPINPEAPFHFNFHSSLTLHNFEGLQLDDLQGLVDKESPELIFCGGWSDSLYLKLIKQNGAIPSVLAFDNQWEGSLKQRLATIYARAAFVPNFNYVFVPGSPQVEYAKKLGFKEDQIFTGVYACELEKFVPFAQKNVGSTSEVKRLIYVGRYIKHKGIFDLFEAFSQLTVDGFDQWELHCLGTGELWDDRPIHPKIQHHGFVQPADFGTHLIQATAFVLPSHFEPWGVVVQECAAAALPMVLSDKIGAASEFLEEGKNGFSFEAGNVEKLKNALRSIMTLSPEEMANMGAHSQILAKKVSPQSWAKSVVEMANRDSN